jgi:hypothetical protein
MSSSKKTQKRADTEARVAMPAARTTRPRARRLSSNNVARTGRPLSRRTSSQAVKASAAVALMSMAAGAGVLLRKPIGALLRRSLDDAMSAGQSLRSTVGRTTAMLGDELEMAHLLARLGLKKRSFWSSFAPGLGMLAAALAASGATALILESRARRVRSSGSGETSKPRVETYEPHSQPLDEHNSIPMEH